MNLSFPDLCFWIKEKWKRKVDEILVIIPNVNTELLANGQLYQMFSLICMLLNHLINYLIIFKVTIHCQKCKVKIL